MKAAFFQLAQVHHPDIAGEGQTARDNFAAITLAYNCLRWVQAVLWNPQGVFKMEEMLRFRWSLVQ